MPSASQNSSSLDCGSPSTEGQRQPSRGAQALGDHEGPAPIAGERMMPTAMNTIDADTLESKWEPQNCSVMAP